MNKSPDTAVGLRLEIKTSHLQPQTTKIVEVITPAVVAEVLVLAASSVVVVAVAVAAILAAGAVAGE